MRIVVAVLLGAVLVTGCGSETGEDSSTGAPGSVGGSNSAASGDDDGSGGILLSTLAKQLTGSLTGGEQFRIQENTVRIEMSSAYDESSSPGQCLIATTARDGVGLTAPITLGYTDRDLDCDAGPE